jgi:selenocysteine lyase/cysteine desulfurase
VDAVQLAPHVAIDVQALGADLLAFSPYKLFGPHAGVLWIRRGLAERLHAYKVRPAGTAGARRFETGTPSFEALAGIGGMVAYLDWLGGEVKPEASTRRERLVAALEAATAYEAELGDHLLQGLKRQNSIRLYGEPTMAGRLPTFGFTVEGHAPAAVAAHLAKAGIFGWAGHFYAVETIARLDLAETGGLVRIGLCHYNTREEVNRLVDALAALNG